MLQGDKTTVLCRDKEQWAWAAVGSTQYMPSRSSLNNQDCDKRHEAQATLLAEMMDGSPARERASTRHVERVKMSFPRFKSSTQMEMSSHED